MSNTLRLFSILYLALSAVSYSSVKAAQLLAGTQTYNNTFGNGAFTNISLAPAFDQTPVVFVLPTTQGGDPSNVRVRNVTTSSFQAAPTEPHREDGPHVAMQSTSISVDKGNFTLPDGTRFEVGTVNTTAQQFGTGNPGTSTWQQVTFNVPFSAAPIVISSIQTMNNEVGESGQQPPAVSSIPFLDVAIRNVTATGFQVSMERSEIDNGSVVTPETIGYMAMEPSNGSFVDSNGNNVIYKSFAYNGARGWTNGCVTSAFPGSAFPANPIAVASKRSRNNPDGGWVRRCSLSTTRIGIRIDEDREPEGDNERGTSAAQAESISVIAFSRGFELVLESFVPIFEVSKQTTTLSDPVNGNTNPKSIPGAIKEYSISVSNMGEGAADANTFVLNDEIPTNSSLVVSGLPCNNAVQFIDGTPSSGLSCGTVQFSQDGVNFGYIPSGTGPNNTDSSVRFIRINPSGIFNAGSATSTPNATFRFRVEVN